MRQLSLQISKRHFSFQWADHNSPKQVLRFCSPVVQQVILAPAIQIGQKHGKDLPDCKKFLSAAAQWQSALASSQKELGQQAEPFVWPNPNGVLQFSAG